MKHTNKINTKQENLRNKYLNKYFFSLLERRQSSEVIK